MTTDPREFGCGPGLILDNLLQKVPTYPTLAGAVAVAEGIWAYLAGDLQWRAFQGDFV